MACGQHKAAFAVKAAVLHAHAGSGHNEPVLLVCNLDSFVTRLQVPVDVVALGYWPQIVVTGVQKGFCGALSTVSTLVNEVKTPSPACMMWLLEVIHGQ